MYALGNNVKMFLNENTIMYDLLEQNENSDLVGSIHFERMGAGYACCPKTHSIDCVDLECDMNSLPLHVLISVFYRGII